jgi:hypothetical protein
LDGTIAMVFNHDGAAGVRAATTDPRAAPSPFHTCVASASKLIVAKAFILPQTFFDLGSPSGHGLELLLRPAARSADRRPTRHQGLFHTISPAIKKANNMKTVLLVLLVSIGEGAAGSQANRRCPAWRARRGFNYNIVTGIFAAPTASLQSLR